MAIIPGGFDVEAIDPSRLEEELHDPFEGLSDEEREEILGYLKEAELADDARQIGIDYGGPMVRGHKGLRPVLIDGLLRIGETMNIIAPPKTGKSWLGLNLALSVVTGRPWFGFPCARAKVLIIDNELHRETGADRLMKVCDALGVTYDDMAYRFAECNQRGHLESLVEFGKKLERLKRHNFKMIIIDAFYRTLPRGFDENDNAAMTELYNLIDIYAEKLDCSFVLIHHTSKGNQAIKALTDVGSGAGAQSRAADVHLILRNHEEKDAVVMEAVVRSFPSVDPVCLRRKGFTWVRDDTLDSSRLAGTKRKRKAASVDLSALEEKSRVEEDHEKIATKLIELVGNPPLNKANFVATVRKHYGIKKVTAELAVDFAIAHKRIRYEGLEDQPAGKQACKFILPPLPPEAKSEGTDASNE